MIDIVIDCNDKIEQIIKQYIDTFCNANFIKYESIKNDFILIKSIDTHKDLEMIKKLNDAGFNYQLISIISNEEYIFDLFDLHKSYFLRNQDIEKILIILRTV